MASVEETLNKVNTAILLKTIPLDWVLSFRQVEWPCIFGKPFIPEYFYPQVADEEDKRVLTTYHGLIGTDGPKKKFQVF